MKNNYTLNPSVAVNIKQVMQASKTETHITDVFLTLVITVWGTGITREMCSGGTFSPGKHISEGRGREVKQCTPRRVQVQVQVIVNWM